MTQAGASVVPEKDQEIYERHSELFHYTTWEGLSGMISSGDVWATRFDFLNDTSEIVHLRDYMFRSLEPFVIEKTKEYVRGSLKRKRQADRYGGVLAAARHNTERTIQAVYDVSFSGSGGFPPHFIPYIASFCSHTDDSEYLKEHGLLSQWRAYGNSNGRFALVFDTRGLHEMLSEIFRSIAFAPLKFSDVIYDDDQFDFGSTFPVLTSELRRHHASYYEGGESDVADALPEAFISAATRLKNRAFAEEREVRIIAVPLTKELRRRIKESTGEDEGVGRELAKINYRLRNGVYIPYLPLFETLKRKLPIRRVIVGPCRDQPRATSMARELLKGTGVPVLVSSIPLRD
jgi:hypothetical protein